MKPRTTLTIIVAVIAFVVAFAMSFMANAYGSRTGNMNWAYAFGGLSIAALVGAIWWGLRNNRSVPVAGAAQREAVLAGAPAAGHGRLIVYRDGFNGKMAGVDILVDGAAVAQLKSPRFVAIDLPPGPHTVSASVQGQTAVPVTVTLAGGGAAAVKAVMVIGGIKVVEEEVAAIRPKLATMPMVMPDSGGAAPIGAAA